MKNEIIVAVLSSTAVATVLGSIIQMFIARLNWKIEKEKIREEREFEEKQTRQKRKEEIYIKALSHSLFVKNILEAFQNEQANDKEELSGMIKEMNRLIREIAPELRLYSSNSIFESFRRLSRSVRIIDSGVEITVGYLKAVDGEYDFLVKLMKKDLGYEEI